MAFDLVTRISGDYGIAKLLRQRGVKDTQPTNGVWFEIFNVTFFLVGNGGRLTITKA